ncbi:hypothetical protein CBR_g57890 [Chara braunii]|uniref:Uncharacterized protein n=1 Tax=Chara braunii TaxID=69332 RepID=A0A388K8D2_CHABU|nr:hypothetical protein CBR_g57890 [Chara braunii]|eukprot:GBG66291.1 hypothetical protein CBR_g57890 [Chara braunii]
MICQGVHSLAMANKNVVIVGGGDGTVNLLSTTSLRIMCAAQLKSTVTSVVLADRQADGSFEFYAGTAECNIYSVSGPLRNSSDLRVVHVATQLGVEAMSAQAVKDVAEVSEVLLKDTTVDQDIVEVEENVLLQDVPAYVVHRPMEGSRCVGTSWMECSTSRIGGMPEYENDDGKTSWYSRMRSRTAGSRSAVYRASSSASASARDGGLDLTDGGRTEVEMGAMEIEGGSGS